MFFFVILIQENNDLLYSLTILRRMAHKKNYPLLNIYFDNHMLCSRDIIDNDFLSMASYFVFL